MNVFCYYEPIPGFEHGELLNLWAGSWRKNGWTPIILGEPQFWLHPFAKEYDEKVSKFPTINDARYDRACFRRWLAMATVGGICCDYDCVNRMLTPYDFISQDKSRKLTVLCANQVPCAVSACAEHYELMANAFAEYQPSIENDRFRGTQKILVEDMTILQRWHPSPLFDELILCEEYNKPGWEHYPLVHCSSASLDGKREWKMRELMP